MLLSVLHRTTFIYAGQAHDSFNEVRLRPVDDALQSCKRYELRIEPAAASRAYQDFYGNEVQYFDVAAGHPQLVVEAESEVETVPDAERPPIPAVTFAELVASPEREMLAEFAADSHYVPLTAEIQEEAKRLPGDPGDDVWNVVQALSRHVYGTFAYKQKVTGVSTTAADALQLRAGVCQDFAHVLLGLCRSRGIPARYVSGYFLNRHLRQGEIEASHAWIEAFVPGCGWVAHDPTHARGADEHYVKVAVGRDYGDIRPVSGTYRGAATRELCVTVKIREVAGRPLPA